MTPGERALVRIRVAQTALEVTTAALDRHRYYGRGGNGPWEIRTLRDQVERWDRELADALRAAEELP